MKISDSKCKRICLIFIITILMVSGCSTKSSENLKNDILENEDSKQEVEVETFLTEEITADLMESLEDETEEIENSEEITIAEDVFTSEQIGKI